MLPYSFYYIKLYAFLLLSTQMINETTGIRCGAVSSSTCSLGSNSFHQNANHVASFQMIPSNYYRHDGTTRRSRSHLDAFRVSYKQQKHAIVQKSHVPLFDNILKFQHGRTHRNYKPHWSKISNDDMEGPSSANGDNESGKKRSVARAGGRTSNSDRNLLFSKPLTTSSNNTIMEWAKKVIPLLVLLTILKGIFGFLFGFGSNSNVIYYQSTVYESRTYDADGKMERIRKESIKSNLPSSMINGNKEDGYVDRDGSSSGSTRGTSLYLDQNFDEELDRELENSFRKSMMIINEYDNF